MHATPTTRRRALAAGLLVIAGVGGAAGLAIGSDHQDTPEVELNPRQDMTDVYAFPGSAPGRIVLVDEHPGLSHARGDRRRCLLRPRSPLPVQDRQRRRRPRGQGHPGDVHRQRREQQVQVRGPVAPPVQGAMMNEVADVSPVRERRDQHPARGFRPTSRSSPARATIRSSSISRPPSASCPTGSRSADRCRRPARSRRIPARRSTSAIPASTTSRASTCSPSWSSCPARRSRTARPASWASGAPSAADAAFTGGDITCSAPSSRPRAAGRSRSRSSRRALAAAACSDDDGDGGTGPAEPRAYNQIQRLGNPLVSEVLLSKRSHPTHGSIGPEDDVALIGAEVVGFLTGPAAWPDAPPSTPTPSAACSCPTC